MHRLAAAVAGVILVALAWPRAGAAAGPDIEPPPPSDRPADRKMVPQPYSLSPQLAPYLPTVTPAPARAERNACVDEQLRRRGLDAYGNPPGTGQPSNGPLIIDQRTGQTEDRYTYVLAHHPDIKTFCSRTFTQP